MDDQEAPRRPIVLVRHNEDQGLVTRGMFIPLSVQVKTAATLAVRPSRSLLIVSIVAFVMTLVGLGALYGPVLFALAEEELPFATVLGAATVPTVLVEDPYSGRALPPQYGPSLRYSDQAFYEKTRQDLISGGASFLDVDLVHDEVRLFMRGVLEQEVGILKKPTTDSWCTVPAGLYQVEETVVDHYSSYLDAYLPSSIIFYGNRFLHGWPNSPDLDAVPTEYDRDCIRLDSADAQHLYDNARVGMPVLVHAPAPQSKARSASYASKVKDFSTPHYLIADINDDTLLAVGEQYQAVPIASLTKLMTALIVLEELPLDKKVAIEESNLIESLVPRLNERSKVSVHTLLELLLVESSNESAEVLANAVGRERFIKLMNERAAQLGLRDTVFTDPAGLESTNVSSVNDLWWLTRYLYKNYPFVIALTRDEAVAPEGVNDGYDGLSNFNEIEGIDSFIGGKVGETEAAGQTSVSLHRLMIGGTERDIVIVLLGSQGRNDDVKALLSYLDSRFEE